MFLSEENPYDWFDHSNDDQRNWARTYLIKKGADSHCLRPDCSWEDIEAATHTVANARSFRFASRMHGAWNQQSSRNALKQKKKRKSFTFVLPVEAGKALNELSNATDMPINQVITNLIFDVATFKRALEECYLKRRKRIKSPPTPADVGGTYIRYLFQPTRMDVPISDFDKPIAPVLNPDYPRLLARKRALESTTRSQQTALKDEVPQANPSPHSHETCLESSSGKAPGLDAEDLSTPGLAPHDDGNKHRASQDGQIAQIDPNQPMDHLNASSCKEADDQADIHAALREFFPRAVKENPT
ncbi:MAG: hypothetical protein WDA10_02745 [Porticoccaceae bacterium]|nr:hypothetical protein [Anaerolineaceae bacterium]